MTATLGLNSVKVDQPLVISVDDDPVYLRLIEIVLGSLPLYLCTTTSPTVAIDLLSVSEAKLVLVDLQMDEMSGERLIRAIRELPNGAEVPILVISSNKVMSEMVARCTTNAACLPKPISPIQLHTVVELVLAGNNIQDAVNRSKNVI